REPVHGDGGEQVRRLVEEELQIVPRAGAPERGEERRPAEPPSARAREVPEVDGEVAGERGVHPGACDASELASRCRADEGVEGELVDLDERDEDHHARDLSVVNTVTAMQVDLDRGLAE